MSTGSGLGVTCMDHKRSPSHLDPSGRGRGLKVRLSVFNLLNEQEVINVVQRYEGQPGQRRVEYGTGTRWQSPRSAQLVVTYNF